MKVLITGSNGFIGRHLVNTLSKQFCVVGQGRIGSNNGLVSENYYEINVNSKSNWQECLNGVDVVVHLAAVAHKKFNAVDSISEVNLGGTIKLAQQAADSGVKRFVFMSTIGVLGNKTAEPFHEGSVASPLSEYAESKWLAEQALIGIANKTALEVVIIRPVMVYGAGAPGNFDRLVGLVKKVPVLPFALCRNKRSFISVNNLVDFISVCTLHPSAAHQVFCISENTSISTKAFFAAVAKGLNTSLYQVPVSIWLMNFTAKLLGKSHEAQQLLGDLEVDFSKARNLLDWTPPESMVQAMGNLKK